MNIKSKKTLGFSLSISMILFSCNQQQIKIAEDTINKNAPLINGEIKTSVEQFNGPASIPTTIQNQNKKPVSIEIKNASLTLREGDTVNLYGEVTYSDGAKDRDIVWTVSDTTSAIIVSNLGVLMATKQGSVEAIATSKTDKNIIAKITIKISKGTIPTTIQPTPTPTPTPTPFPSSSTSSSTSSTSSSSTSSTSSSSTSSSSTSSSSSSSSSGSTSSTSSSSGSSFIAPISFSGTVYDINKNSVSGVTVQARSLDSSSIWSDVQTTSTNGEYAFRGAPTNVNIEITISKVGWTSNIRIINLSPSTTTAAASNIFEFGNGPLGTDPNGQFAIQLNAIVGELATFNGKVFDMTGAPVHDATVTAVATDGSWEGVPQQTQSGAYVFRNVPVGIVIQISATKDNWTVRNRVDVIKSNLSADPKANVFDFGNGNGVNGTDAGNLYAIQNNPEVIYLTVNGQIAEGSDISDTKNPSPRKPDILSPPNGSISLSSDKLTVGMVFSEPVRRDDVENYFRVVSQSNFDSRATNFTLDRNLSSISFTWASDDTAVIFNTSKAILANRTGSEAKYMIDFTQNFRDKSDNPSLTGNFFKFSNERKNDFHVFSVENQFADPFIQNIQAIDGTTNDPFTGTSVNDRIKITFSKQMDVLNKNVPQALLADPTNSITQNDSTLQLYAYSTNNGFNSNNTTILGYKDKATGNFKAIYSIARITQSDLQLGNSLRTRALNGGFSNSIIQYGGATSPLKLVQIFDNIATIEFNPQAFDKNDIVILSAGQTVDGQYNDPIKNINVPSLKTGLPVNGSDFVKITDPAGRPLDSGNSSISNNIDVNNSQRVSIAN